MYDHNNEESKSNIIVAIATLTSEVRTMRRDIDHLSEKLDVLNNVVLKQLSLEKDIELNKRLCEITDSKLTSFIEDFENEKSSAKNKSITIWISLAIAILSPIATILITEFHTPPQRIQVVPHSK